MTEILTYVAAFAGGALGTTLVAALCVRVFAIVLDL